jgi:DEAD/DEAH box helicase domain-containing protein
VPDVATRRSESFHAFLREAADGDAHIAAAAFFPPRAAVYVGAGTGPYERVLAALGIVPYRHQGEALRHVAAGRDTVVATGTGSGKSLVFQAPVLDALERGGTALLVYPTKALAGDQAERFARAAAALGLDPSLIVRYDGDTPGEARRRARSEARVLITNPDMLHYGIVPFAGLWRSFFASLRLVVVDEVHAYRGVMGVHVANVLRRTLRTATGMGATPTVVAASATIGNPAEHLGRLTGRAAAAIDEDDAPKGPREFIVWRPGDLPGGEGRRRSATTEAARLGGALARAGVKTLVFCTSRRAAELVRRYLVEAGPPELAGRVLTYRGGYTAEDRERIAKGFRDGDVTVLVTTSALELGIDVGGVDAVVLVGYPGSISSLWQRAGRAGREGGRSLCVWIPAADPLDEYYLAHPELLTEGRPEAAIADPWNEELHPAHVLCAAAERPLRADEPVVAPWLDLATLPGLVPVTPDPSDGAPRWGSVRRYPHRAVRIRGGSGLERVRLRDADGTTLGVTDGGSALRDLHPGAVYLHQGEAYLCVRLDLQRGEATLLPHLEDYYTQARSETDVEILEVWRDGLRPGERAPSDLLITPPRGVGVGRVLVRSAVTGYVRKRYHHEGVLDERALDLPELSYPTQACWFEVDEVAHGIEPTLLASSMHALEHTLIGLLPAFVLCERADVGGVSYPSYPATGRPLIVIYDGHPGGVGYARAGAGLAVDWLRAAHDLLARCPCARGCPRCVLSPKCGNGNQMLDKRGAHELAGRLLVSFEG